MGAALLLIVPEFGLTSVQTGMLASLPFVAMALGALIVGPLCDRFGRRPVYMFDIALFVVCALLQAAILVSSAATVVCGFARNFETMLVGRAGVGAGEAGRTPGATSMLGDMFEPRKLSFPTGVYMASVKAGQSCRSC